MKFVAVVILNCLVLAYICVTSDALSNHVSWGARSLRDVLLHREVVFHESRFIRKSTGDYSFEQKNAVGYPKIITMVNVTDQYKNGKGGKATLTSGGPNYHHVKLHLTSQRGYGYNFIVDIYGY